MVSLEGCGTVNITTRIACMRGIDIGIDMHSRDYIYLEKERRVGRFESIINL